MAKSNQQIGTRMKNKIWTDALIKLLTDDWNAGLTASEVAINLQAAGYNITRNAVIGKVHRLGLEEPEGKSRKRRAQASAAMSKIRNVKIRIKDRSIMPVKPPTEVIMVKKPDPAKAVLLIHTKSRSCRAIIGYVNNELGKAMCCGEMTTHEGGPWCQYHHDIYTQEMTHGRYRKSA